MKLGHKYTIQRGRMWLRALIVIGAVMILSLFLMLLNAIPPAVFLLIFVVYAAATVCAILDFALPILKKTIEHIEQAQGELEDGGQRPNARSDLSVRIEQCLIDAHGRAIQPRTIADRIGAPLPDVEITLIGLHEEDRIEPYGWSGCWKLPEPPKEMA